MSFGGDSNIRGSAKGATQSGPVTSTSQSANNQALDVQVWHGGSTVNPTAIRALTASDVVTAQQGGTWTVAQGTAAAATAPWAARLSDGAAFYTAPSSSQLPSTLVGGRLDVNVGASITLPVKTEAQIDYDTGAGTQSLSVIGLALPASGGAVAGGTATNPLRIDPTGTTAQPVTGTFWQATQPVSIAATVTTDPSDRAARLLGVVYGSQGQQLKQTATNFNLQVESAVGATLIDPRSIRALTSSDVVTAAQGTAAALAGRWPVIVTDGTNTMPTGDAVSRAIHTTNTDGTNVAAVKAASTAAVAGDPSLVVALSPNTAVTPPTLTKGTQGATGFSTQDLKDAGRVYTVFTATAVACVTTEALVSLTPYRDLTAGSAGTSHAVTSGKRLRLTSITLTVRATSTVAVHGLIRLRLLAGTVLVGSPVHLSVGCGTGNITPAVIGHALSTTIPIPDGLELSGTMQLGCTQLFSATSATIDVQISGFEY